MIGEAMEARSHYSRKREAIIAAVKEDHSHPSAETLYTALKKKYPDLSLGTVYRNLSQLKENGVVRPVAVVNGQERVDGIGGDHPHFICTKCGKVEDVKLPERYDFSAVIENVYGHQVDHCELIVYGKCLSCVRGKQTES